jgi:hypothetical protein
VRPAWRFLAGAAALWLVAGLTGVVVGTVSPARVTDVLPPLAVGPEAVGGAITVISIGVAASGPSTWWSWRRA